MARVELADEVLVDLDRIVDHLVSHDVANVSERIAQLLNGLEVLGHSPLIGRPAGAAGLRELVIGQGARGYVALYRHVADIDTAFVLAIRAQRESGYRRST